MARTLSLHGKEYEVDQENFLLDPAAWEEDFAEGMAHEAGITGPLLDRHWEVIRFIRRFWMERGICPTVFQTCRILGLHLSGFRFLFPGGYRRGACKLAGVSHRTLPPTDTEGWADLSQKSYRIDIWGFLLDPDEWDDRFAILKAQEMKVPGGLTSRHWEVLRFLRGEYYRTGKIPTIFETCDAMGLDLQSFEGLFPDGYTRGAIKLAGLRTLDGAAAEPLQSATPGATLSRKA